MTTIAITSTHIAADGLTTANEERLRADTKKIVVRRADVKRAARIIAMAGSGAMRDAVVDWFEAGADPKNVPPLGKSGTFTLIIIDVGPGGSPRMRYLSDDLPYMTELALPQAFGSGSCYAMGALKHGATAREAVAIAASLDVSTGGEIQEIDIHKALGLVDKPVHANGNGVHAGANAPY
jgi:hypothetical protein